MLLLHGLNCRHFRKSIFQMKWDSDAKWLLSSIILGFILVVPTAYIPGLRDVFYQGAITWEWGIVAVANVIFMCMVEIYKLVKRNTLKTDSVWN